MNTPSQAQVRRAIAEAQTIVVKVGSSSLTKPSGHLDPERLNALVAAAVVNGGKVVQPTLVDRVRSSDLSVISQTKPQVMSRAFSSGTANKLTQMMESVVTKENPNLAIDGVQVAAKTGTAQIGDGNTSIDGWVVGFAPADDPKIAVAVVVHNVDLYGSFAAGPIMKAMMQEALAE